MGRRLLTTPVLTQAAIAATVILAMPFFASAAAPTESLEWMVADADLVVRVTVVKTDAPGTSAGRSGPAIVWADVLEVMKGPQYRHLAFPASRYMLADQAGYSMPATNPSPLELSAGTPLEWLLFFVDDARASLGPEERGWVYHLRRAIPLPAGLVEPGIITMDLRLLNRSEDILYTAWQAGRAEGSGRPLSHTIMLRPEFQQRGIPHLVTVPADGRLERLAQQWAKGHVDEWNAVRALERFPTPENAVLLQDILKTNNWYTVDGYGKWRRRNYVVRMRAYGILCDWKVPVDRPVMAEYHDPYRPVAMSYKALALAGLIVMAWRCRRRRKASDREFPLPTPVLGAVSVTLALLTIALALCWVRSCRRMDDFMLGGESHQHELASYGGGVRLMRFGEWSGPRALYHGSFPYPSQPDWTDTGDQPSLLGKQVWHRLGFWLIRGHTVAPLEQWPPQRPYPAWPVFVPVTRPYQLVRVPYWPLLLVAGFLPVLRVRSLARRVWRGWHGRCVVCAYDLRASRKRCPECGTAFG